MFMQLQNEPMYSIDRAQVGSGHGAVVLLIEIQAIVSDGSELKWVVARTERKILRDD